MGASTVPGVATAPMKAAEAAPIPRPLQSSNDLAPPVPVKSPDTAAHQQLARSLELAAACLRRNEVDRARRLLEDVVRSGDETQREFARALLSRLG